MKLNNPNTESYAFEQLENYFSKLNSEQYRCLSDDETNIIIACFKSQNFYNKPIEIVNTIEIKSGKKVFYVLHILIDLRYGNSRNIQADSIYEENLWAFNYQSTEYGEIAIIPKEQFYSKHEISLNNFIQKILKKIFKKNDSYENQFYDFSYSNDLLFRNFMAQHILEKFFAKKQNFRIKCSAKSIYIGNYSDNMVANLSFYHTFFQK